MPDDKLTQRIRKLLGKRPDVVEKRMFGGVAFMIRGHMACGTQSGRLVLRLGEQQTRAAIKQPFVEPMNFTGRVMKSMVFVHPPAIATASQLRRWVEPAVAFADSLPCKKAKPAKKTRETAAKKRRAKT